MSSKPRQSKNKLPRGVYQRTVNGSTSFLVSLGRDGNGKQRWKSCKTEDEALAQRQLVGHAKRQQGESLWLLSAEQRGDAVNAFQILKDHPGETLTAAAEFYLKQHLSLSRQQQVAGLLDKFIAEHETAGVSLPTMRDLRCRLKPLKTKFGNRLANEVTVEDIKLWDKEMTEKGLSPLSRRHYLNKAASFWRWAVANKFAYSTPLDPLAVRRPKVVRGGVRFFTVDECKKILERFSAQGLRSYAVLGLFCGIRPEEVRRLHAHHFKIDGDTLVITLDADITKTVWRRVIELRKGTLLGDCVWAWLGGNGKLELPEKIAPSLATWRRRFRKIQPALGFPWVNDGMRHTAATFHFALSRDEQATSALLGHTSTVMLRTHYKGMTTESEAKKFYALRPTAAEEHDDQE